MKKRKKIISLICAATTAASLLCTVPVFADATKVVSFGNDLTEQQKNTMLKYFNIQNDSSVQKISVTNKDEIGHLSAFVPKEQIGTRTVSCAYIKPTESGGIRVKTANLEYVTANMIATTIADLGIKNCEVVAACPFKVSGTGALTGIIMAYETATGEDIDEKKKEIATQEMVIIKDISKDIGAEKAETIINQAKAEAVQNNIADKQEIQNTINNIITENNINITNEQIQNITNLTQNIVNQDYGDDYVEIITNITENNNTEDVAEDSITSKLDEEILGEDVIVSATEESDLTPEQLEETVQNEEFDENEIELPESNDAEVDDESINDNSADTIPEVSTSEEATENIENNSNDYTEDIPDVSKFGFNIKEIADKEGNDAAKEFIKIEEYMIKYFPAEWTETELMTKDIKPEEKMSEVSGAIMNVYYNYLLEEEHQLPLFDTFMKTVTDLLNNNKITEDEAAGLHEIAPLEESGNTVESEEIESENIVVEQQGIAKN